MPSAPKKPAKRRMGVKVDSHALVAKAAPRPKPPGYVFGRPTKYEERFCQLAIDCGREGKSLVSIAVACGVDKETLVNWTDAHPDFLRAMKLARVLSQEWWEESGRLGMLNKSIDSSIYSRSMGARFPEDWRENNRTELSGKDGGPIEVNNTGSITALAALLRGGKRSA